MSDEEIRNRFQLLPEPSCEKANLREPKKVGTPYFSERHYLTIDGNKECQILDVWVVPLTDRPDENRRYMESVLYRREGKIWVKEYGLAYAPALRVMDKRSGRV